MCFGCWDDHGRPVVDTPAVRAAAAAVGELYEMEPVAGALHVVVDDWNTEDDHLAYCRKEIKAGHVEPESASVTINCLVALEALTEKERISALALEAGYWGA